MTVEPQVTVTSAVDVQFTEAPPDGLGTTEGLRPLYIET
jgi:hypothetical protein